MAVSRLAPPAPRLQESSQQGSSSIPALAHALPTFLHWNASHADLRLHRLPNFEPGPGVELVFDAQGDHLGTLLTDQATANCASGDDGRTLYIVADSYLLRIRLIAQGLGFELHRG